LIELQRWLVFLDECGVGARVAYGLKQKSLDVVTVQSGEHFRQLDEQAYEINPRRRSDYESLFKELQTRDKFPHGIAHLWAVTPDEGQASEGGDFAELQDAGFNSLLYLTQSLDDLKLTAPLHLCALSNDMQMVTGEESLRPEKATLTGLCLVIPQEYPHITCRSVDVSLRHLTGDGRDRLCVYLTAELLSQNSETMVAYRGLQKWARSFEPLMVETKAGAGLKQGGAYLITGGLGNIGLLLASHLASTVRAKLVLVSRSALPAREDWEQWLTTATPEDSVSQKLRAIRAMEACGAEVLIAQADVADKQQMQAMMLEACERFGDFDGVIHAAGLVGESWLKPIRETDTHLLEAHLRPKAHGLMVLDQLLEGKKVDFCLLVSSLSAIIGGAGYAAYAAANLFMDALAHRRNLKGGVPWMSANWDGWQTQFEGDVESLPASRFGMVAHEGLKAFETLLPLIPLTPQLVISTGDLTARVNQLVKRERASAVSTALTIEDAAAAYPRTGMQHQYVAPGDELERGIAQVWAEALGVGQVGIHDSFFELGGDSLLATQILPRLRENVQVDLTLRNFFEVPTVAGLASLITRLREEQQAAQETEILKMLDLLSEEELEAELNKRMQITES
jgi:NAD(P)-dependent dehydrogenase (short-subunit alcohol dehydrogenase family)